MDDYTAITPAILDRIRGAVGSSRVITRSDILEEYGRDAGECVALPECIVEARSADDISCLITLANELRFPVTPRGLGTGLAGGAVPIYGGVVLSLAGMNRIIDIDRNNLIAVVEPGVLNLDFKEAVRREGLFYPPDPASLDTSSLGGNAATNAGGPACVKYGTTRDYVLGLEAVLPTGEIIDAGVRTRKGVVGYDLLHLIVGSEGTLGVITRLILKLLPHPEGVTTMVAFFPDPATAMSAVTAVLTAGHIPSAIELLDDHCIALVGDLLPFDDISGIGALLLVETDGPLEIIEREIQAIGEICLDRGGMDVLLAPDSHKRAKLWEIRRQVALRIEEHYPVYIPEDIVVPIGRIADFISCLPEYEVEYGMTVYAFGHAGDGNIHLNITADDPGARCDVDRGIGRLLEKVIAMGGTISGEHGIGVVKKPFLSMELSDTSISLQRRIKDLFDPRHILNPGKLF